MSGMNVKIAYVHDGDQVSYSFHHCFLQLLSHDALNQGRVWNGGVLSVRARTDGLAFARNEAVRTFLNGVDGVRAEWLWWVDTDMGFPPDVVDRLLEVADPDERPVVGALCFANREMQDDGMGGWRAFAAPTIMHRTDDPEKVGNFQLGLEVDWTYPKDTLLRCDATGSACILIHRGVFERVQESFGEDWYSRSRSPSTGELVSEDLSFCVRLRELGIPVHVHTGVQTTHFKSIWLQEQDYRAQRAVYAPNLRVVS